ncbi:MAG TPA: hypothetical protein VHN99_11315 [Deinococcales bacterium]|nr:hypothetical protein [Deinococcales bacterium]
MATGLPDNLTREEYGRQYFNHQLFDVWVRDGARLEYATWAEVPDAVQFLDTGTFRARVYLGPGESPEP